MLTFKLNKKEVPKDLYKKYSFDFEEGITYLVGKNGSGKSTLLNEIKKDTKLNSLYYSNEESERYAMDILLDKGNVQGMMRNMVSSEGQNIVNNFSDFVYKIGQFVRKCYLKKSTYGVVLLDGLDSGLSIDKIKYIREEALEFIYKDCQKRNLKFYIIVAANNYELCKNADCIDITTGKHITFKTYEEFTKFYLGGK